VFWQCIEHSSVVVATYLIHPIEYAYAIRLVENIAVDTKTLEIER